jgi:hypothetical protein
VPIKEEILKLEAILSAEQYHAGNSGSSFTKVVIMAPVYMAASSYKPIKDRQSHCSAAAISGQVTQVVRKVISVYVRRTRVFYGGSHHPCN